jgi:hypothetical protein
MPATPTAAAKTVASLLPLAQRRRSITAAARLRLPDAPAMLPSLLALLLLPAAGPAALEGKPDPKQGLVWYDARALGIEGQGWTKTAALYDRLPAAAEKLVRPPVWGLSRHSAGLCVRFTSDATALSARWTVNSKNLAMPHMPATGVSGLDLYVRHQGKWRWLGAGRPQGQTSTARLAAGLPAGPQRDFLLYLPLYNGVASVEVGLPAGSKMLRAPAYPAHKKPLVFYGTSIMQGGCASRPGMVHTAILGRRLDWPVINLGFSGNGRLEMELAKLLGEIDAAAYVIDCLPNLQAKDVAARAEPFVLALRKARPDTPILLVEDRSPANADLLPGVQAGTAARRAALRSAFEKMTWEGVPTIHYQAGDRLLGDDGEATVDSSHPTDLGFLRQADATEPILRYLLADARPRRAAVEGYTDRLSYVAGEEIRFHTSTRAQKYTLEIARVGAERAVVWKKEALPGKEHPVPADASSHGCRWPVALAVQVPPEWRSGYYAGRLSAKLPDGKTAAAELFFVVRPAKPGQDTKVLLQLATNTYNAYCNWGGYSLYAYNGHRRVQGRRVSFDRPIAGQFRNWELPFVQWAEKAGYRIDYAVNSDLEQHPDLLKHYRLVLSVGHDEYWSSPMRDSLEKFIRSGGNVAFLSGNTCCWQVRSEDKGRALVCFKQAYRADPLFARGERKLLSTLWSHHLVGRPENGLTGVGFLWGGYHKSHGQFMDGSGAYTVHRPDHWLFAGTGLARGSAFGGKDTIVGYECDGCELTWKDGLPYPTHADGTPKGFQALATAPARWHPDDCEWYEKWQKGRTGQAVLGVYTSGGTVVTVGSTDWSHGLRGNDPVVVRITRNILDRLAK